MDRSRLRKKVFLDLLSAPWTLLPGVGGLSLLILAGVIGQGAEYMIVAGAAGVLAALGSMATRWIWSADDIVKKAFEQLQADALKKEEEMLDDLQRRLQKDKDPRTERYLQDLRGLYTGFRGSTTWTKELDQRSAPEIAQKVDTLFRGCVHSLERSLHIWETAQKIRSKDTKKSVLDIREQQLKEIEQSIQQLIKAIDEVQALAVKKKSEQNLARIREELNESLNVARRVEERMQALDAEIDRRVVRAERE